MEAIKINPIDVSVVETENKAVAVLATEAERLMIKTQDDFSAAGELRKRAKGKIKQLEEIRKGITVPLDNAKAAVMALFKPPTEKLNEIIGKVDTLTIAYTDEQDRIAREAQAKAEEEARKAREKAEAKAKEFEAKGNGKKAEEWKEKAETVVAPVITAATPKVAGQFIQERWYAEVIDFKALSDDYKIVDQSKLDKVAQATKGKINITGVKFYSKKIVSGRSM